MNRHLNSKTWRWPCLQRTIQGSTVRDRDTSDIRLWAHALPLCYYVEARCCNKHMQQPCGIYHIWWQLRIQTRAVRSLHRSSTRASMLAVRRLQKTVRQHSAKTAARKMYQATRAVRSLNRSATTARRGPEPSKDCSATVNKNSSSENVPGIESSAITESFGNDSEHARSSETAKDCLATVSKISVKSVNRAITARQVSASWKTGVYLVMVKALLTSFAIEVRGDLPSITNEDCTDTGAATEQWGDFRTGTSETCTVFPVQLDKTQQQRSVQLHQWRTQHRDEQISTQQHASNQKTAAEHTARTKLEQTLGKLQKMFADNAEAEMNAEAAAATTFRNQGIRTPTEDTQPHPAGNTTTCTLDYSKLLGIIKQM